MNEQEFKQLLTDNYTKWLTDNGMNGEIVKRVTDRVIHLLDSDELLLNTIVQFAQQEYNRGWDEACDMGQSILSLKIKENEGE